MNTNPARYMIASSDQGWIIDVPIGSLQTSLGALVLFIVLATAALQRLTSPRECALLLSMSIGAGIVGAWGFDGLATGRWRPPGLSLAGAILAGSVTLWLAAGRRLPNRRWEILAALAPSAAFAAGVARLGCLGAACDYGRMPSWDLPWRVRHAFDTNAAGWLRSVGDMHPWQTYSPGVHPFALYDALGLWVTAGLALALRRRWSARALALFVATGAALSRATAEAFRGNAPTVIVGSTELPWMAVLPACLALVLALALSRALRRPT